MAKKFPEQRVLFASWQRPRDIRNLSDVLVSMLPPFGFKHSTVHIDLASHIDLLYLKT